MQSKRALWLAEVILGAIGIILALKGEFGFAVAIAGLIATTMDKLIEK